MKRAWLVLVLILIISTQIAVLSAFHNVEVGGFASGNSVLTVAKWDYAQGSVYISVTPALARNGSFAAELVWPNGTAVELSTSSPYSFTYELPRTGDCLCSGATSGPVSLSSSVPMNVTITQNVSDVTSLFNYLNSLSGQRSASPGSQPYVDVYAFVIYGDAQVEVSGYVIAI